MPYNALLFKDAKRTLVTYSLQLLLVLLIYPIPESAVLSSSPHPSASYTSLSSPLSSASPRRNYYRHFCGRLHRAQDFQFIVDGMLRVLNQPLKDRTSSYLGSAPQTLSTISASKSTSSSMSTADAATDHLVPALLMLFWEMLQCNRRFRAFIIDTERAHDFVVLAIFYAADTTRGDDASRHGVARMCAFLLQTLSAERNFGINLNKTFEGQESLPAVMRITPFVGTYGDFLVQVSLEGG